MERTLHVSPTLVVIACAFSPLMNGQSVKMKLNPMQNVSGRIAAHDAKAHTITVATGRVNVTVVYDSSTYFYEMEQLRMAAPTDLRDGELVTAEGKFSGDRRIFSASAVKLTQDQPTKIPSAATQTSPPLTEPQQASSYINNGSIGTQPTKSAPARSWPQFRVIPSEEWKGKSLLFLSGRSVGIMDRPYYYGGWRYSQRDSGGVYHQSNKAPDYDTAAGKTGKIIEVRPNPQSDDIVVTVAMDGSRDMYTYVGTSLQNTVLTEYIDQARRELLGKTLWMRSSSIKTYDAQSNQVNTLAVKKFSPVKVAQVVASWDAREPVRLIVTTETGAEGFIDVWTPQLDGSFFPSDPKLSIPWPKAVWDAIQDERLVIGMNQDQVNMSWGTPSATSQVQSAAGVIERWKYGHAEADFKNGLLVSFGDLN